MKKEKEAMHQKSNNDELKVGIVIGFIIGVGFMSFCKRRRDRELRKILRSAKTFIIF